MQSNLVTRRVPAQLRRWVAALYCVLGTLGVMFCASVYDRLGVALDATSHLIARDLPDQRNLHGLRHVILEIERALYEYYATEDTARYALAAWDASDRVRWRLADLERGLGQGARVTEVREAFAGIARAAGALDRNLASPRTDWDAARDSLAEVSGYARRADAALSVLLSALQEGITRRSREAETQLDTVALITVACSLLLFGLALFSGRGIMQFVADGWHQRRLAFFVERNPVLILSLSEKGEVLYANPSAAVRLGGEDGASLPGALRTALDARLGRTSATQYFECTLHDRLYECQLHFLSDLEIHHLYLSDITERRQAELELSHAAHHDTLTGLRNRRALLAELDARIGAADGRPLALALMDIQRFSAVVEQMGRDGGDAALTAVAARLQGLADLLRQGDGSAGVFRLEGDTFCMLLEGLTVAQTDSALATLRSLFEAPFNVVGQELFLSVAIGLVHNDTPGLDAAQLIYRADLARQRAKRDDAATICVYDPELERITRHARTLDSALHRAIENEELRLVYQPQFDIRRARICGAEALLRWHHPGLGAVSPAEFIPLAERSRLMLTIGWWVIEQACAQWLAWRNAGIDPGAIAVNVSARQLREADFCARLGNHLRGLGMPADAIEIEITESVAMRDADATIQTLAELRILGCRVAIDDFGTGYSSFSYLNRFALNTLKIDQSFIRPMTRSRRETTLVQAMIDMAHKLDLQVVGEGVETAEHLVLLRDLGCDFAQGHHIARPLEAADFGALLASSIPDARSQGFPGGAGPSQQDRQDLHRRPSLRAGSMRAV